MSKKMYDSWFDSTPAYFILIAAHLFLILALIFGWTDYGLNIRAASTAWHVVGVIALCLCWVVMALGKTDRTFVDFDYPVWIAIFLLLYIFPFLALAGFTFNIVS